MYLCSRFMFGVVFGVFFVVFVSVCGGNDVIDMLQLFFLFSMFVFVVNLLQVFVYGVFDISVLVGMNILVMMMGQMCVLFDLIWKLFDFMQVVMDFGDGMFVYVFDMNIGDKFLFGKFVFGLLYILIDMKLKNDL